MINYYYQLLLSITIINFMLLSQAFVLFSYNGKMEKWKNGKIEKIIVFVFVYIKYMTNNKCYL